MRAYMAAAGAMLASMALALPGCGQSERKGDANAAAANYRPPTVTARRDFGGVIERRFHRYDRDGDGKLSKAELPERLHGAIARNDRDGDGMLSSDEWGAMMLDRFDAQDLDRDGNVTSDERRRWREQRRQPAD